MNMPPLRPILNHSRLQAGFLWLCAGTAFVLVTVALFHQYRFEFDSDAASRSVLARLAMHEGKLVPHHWVYGNGDLWILNAYIFSILLYPWFGMSFFSNVAAAWLTYLFLSLTVFGACRVLEPRHSRAAIIATTLSVGGLSLINFQFTIAQGVYSLYAALTLCLFAFVVRSVSRSEDSKSSARLTTYVLAFSAAALMCLSNDTRGLATAIAPIILGWLVAVMLLTAPTSTDRWRRLHNPIINSIIAGAIAGTLLYKYWLMPGLSNYNAVAQVAISSRAEMWQHFVRLPAAWFASFGSPDSWQSKDFMLRMLQCAQWMLAAAAILIPIWMALTPKRQSHATFTLAWMVLAGYAVSFGALIVSPHLFVDTNTMRYATLPLYGAICLVALACDRAANKYRRAGGVLILAVVLAAVFTAFGWRASYAGYVNEPGGNYPQRMELINTLEQHQVGTLLAPYWKSHVLSVLSNGKVNAYPVRLAAPGPLLKPDFFLVPTRLLYGTAGTRQAVINAGPDSNKSFWSVVQSQIGEPTEKLVVGPFTAWIYHYDIATAVFAPGHEADTAVPSQEVAVRLSKMRFPRCASGASCKIGFETTNIGQRALDSIGNLPLRLGVQEFDKDGKLMPGNGRADFPRLLPPGHTAQITATLDASDRRVSSYRVCLMQEHVAWLCDRTFVPAGQPR